MCESSITALKGEAASSIPAHECDSAAASSDFDRLISGHRLTQTALSRDPHYWMKLLGRSHGSGTRIITQHACRTALVMHGSSDTGTSSTPASPVSRCGRYRCNQSGPRSGRSTLWGIFYFCGTRLLTAFRASKPFPILTSSNRSTFGAFLFLWDGSPLPLSSPQTPPYTNFE